MIRVGPYSLGEPIGEGGMAQVFRASGPGGDVALKILRTGAGAPEAQRRRFEREVRVMESIAHPHLIEVLDHGFDEERGPWLAMPLVRGMTLRDLFAGQRLAPEAALLLLAPMVEALAALHAEGLVHRDVKPENLMLSPLGDVTLVDLGLALGDDDTRHTKEGEVTGSLPYMSPERIEGRDVDPTADVWAVGVMIYELICGERPFARARASEEVAAILAAAPEPLRERDRRVSPELDWLVGICLARDPWSRPKDARALLDRMNGLILEGAEERKSARVSILSDRARYERQIAEKVATSVREQAKRALSTGDTFEALRMLDRALAYLPDDPEALELVEKASTGDVEVPPPPEPAPAPARRRRPALWLGTAVALVAAGGLAAYLALPSEPEATVAEPTPSEPVEEAIDGGLAADAGERLSFHPIPPDVLSNHDPEDLGDLVAGDGEPLVGPDDFDGDPEEALRRAQRSLEDDPDDLDARLTRAMASLALGETERGLGWLERLAEEYDGDAEVWTALGFVRMRQGRLDEADAAFGRALSIDPSHAPALRHRGILRRRRGRTRDAYRDLVGALRLDPDDAHALSEMTELFQNAGRAADAAPLLRRLLRTHPRHVEGWTSLSIALSRSRDPEDLDAAIEAVERALELAPEYVRAHRQYCTLLAQNQRAGAIGACDAAIRADPTNPELFAARAHELARQELWVRAIADADRAIELAPAEGRHYGNRAIIRGLSGDDPGAMSDLTAACRLGHDTSCRRLRSMGVTPTAGAP